MAPVACLSDEENVCERADKCSTLPLWKKLDTAIRDVIDTTTLADLIES